MENQEKKDFLRTVDNNRSYMFNHVRLEEDEPPSLILPKEVAEELGLKENQRYKIEIF